MAVIYLRSTDGNDGDSGATWALAKATLAAALTAAGAGGTVYMSQAHAETSASATMNFVSPGTFASPTLVICCSDAAEPPTVRATTGTVTNTAASSNPRFTGSFYAYGFELITTSATTPRIDVAFDAGADAVVEIYESCKFTVSGSFTGRCMRVGNLGASATGHDTRFINCTFKYANVGQFLSIYGPTLFQGGSVDAGGTVPTVWLNWSTDQMPCLLTIADMDLSALGSGKSILDLATPSTGSRFVRMTNCKLGSSVAFTSGTSAAPLDFEVINCDSADTNYRYYRQTYQGTEQQETTIYRTGGASDGTTPISRKIVATSTAKSAYYYEARPIEFWNTSLAAQTVTIPIVSSVTLQDADIWIVVEYLGTASVPLGNLVSSRIADPIFGTPANLPTDSTSSWASSPSTPVYQSLVSPSFTCTRAGIVRVWVMMAKASTTVYYDPKALSTSGRQYTSEAGMVNEGGAPIVMVSNVSVRQPYGVIPY